MPRYVAFLRGISPMNAKMPELKSCFEVAGFKDVRTLLSSGNVVFDSVSKPLRDLERRAEKAMQSELGRIFAIFIRPTAHIQALIESDPFSEFNLPPTAKRVVTFLSNPAQPGLKLPIERDNASILKIIGSEVLCAYVPSTKGPVFMTLLERHFGTIITTRTLYTVRKCALA